MKNIKIITIIIAIICILLYEFGFCNLYNLLNGTYSFSLFRIITYLTIILSCVFFSNKLIENTIDTLKGKNKFIITYIAITTLYTLFLVVIRQEELGRIALIVMAELLGILFIIYITKDYIQNIIVTTLTFGLLFCLTNYVFHEMDEKQHFNSALNLAYFNLNYIEEPLGDLKFNEIEPKTKMEHFIMGYSNEPYKMKMEEIEFNPQSVPMDYSPILYIPSALGINIARLFNGTMLDVFIAGRVANLLAFSAMLILIFKLLPFKKNTFYCMYLLPQTVALAASYSIDAITVGIIGIFIAYTLKLYKEEKEVVSIKQSLILLGSFLICLLSKHGVYLAICVIVFILPIIKSIKKDKKIIFLILGIILIAGILGGLKLKSITANITGDEKMLDTSPKMQLDFIMKNPELLPRIYKECFNLTIFNLQYYEGLNLINFMGDGFRVVAFFLFIYCIYIAINDGSFNFKRKEKGVFIVTFMLNFFIGTMTLYLLHTPVYTLAIYGYQARYLIPILPLVLMCIPSNNINVDNQEEVYNPVAKNLGLFMLVDLISQIMS